MRAGSPTAVPPDSYLSPDEHALLTELRGRGAHQDRPGLAPLGGLGTYEGALAVDLQAPFRGRPLRDTRDLLRRADSYGIRPHEAARVLDTDEPAAVAFLDALAGAGLLTGPGLGEEPPDDHGRDWRTWEITESGHVLAYATGRSPSTRRAADALVAKVLKAARAINENPDEFLWWVQEVRAVGQLADPDRQELLHVDLAVRLRPRLADPAEQAKAKRRLEDDALDRGEGGRVRDMFGYGHWRTRLALAGRSKVVRLFTCPEGVEDGKVLFREEHDLTVAAAPTPPYERPAEPAPVDRCTWCRRAVPSTRVAVMGMSVDRSPIALCEACLALGRGGQGGFLGSLSLYGAVHDTLERLAAEPYHPDGCALCGNARIKQGRWWQARECGREEQRSVELRLCDVCPGLLDLADRADREGWWRSRHEAACLAGFAARLHQRAGIALPAPQARPKRRPLPRLTGVHRDLLADIRAAGALSAVDLARRSDRSRHQDSKWWTVRLNHLAQHGLVTVVGTDGSVWSDPVRAVEDDERALRGKLDALHVAGPRWDGEAVVEPEPPAGWQARAAVFEPLRADRDRKALAAAGARS
ncbi:hypothetical protein ACFVT9_29155 [Kitasatospora cineracea]|uniref:hypothetical protein n=1 Tax=Kitasatospora cineracea TaxID=88074 RepID=UPI0036DAADC0